MASHLPDPNSIKFIIDSINRLPLFATINNNTHDVYLLIHQLVPQDLYNIIYSYTHKHSIIKKIIFEFMTSFFNYFLKIFGSRITTSFTPGNEPEIFCAKINVNALNYRHLILLKNLPPPGLRAVSALITLLALHHSVFFSTTPLLCDPGWYRRCITRFSDPFVVGSDHFELFAFGWMGLFSSL
uniref:Uncharacterized protein n=1 Tax=Rhizophagus irregularis (strain DAOM 181602 / DAOM 197198 / MUCL 43194) TaxID=747089 RepID=U9TB79_RHIID